MQYRTFGKSGRQVSILGFGAMRVPTHEDRTADLEQAVPLLRKGLDLGINYIDTAHGYCEGTSEVAVGQAVKGYERAALTITTKVPAGDAEKAGGANWRERLDLSLGRLDTYIDFILFHGLKWEAFQNFVSQPGGALEAARKAQAEGLVKHIGFSSHDTADNVIRLIDTGEFEAMLVQYNFLDRHNEPAIARAHAAGMGVSIMGPIAGGRLAMAGAVGDGHSPMQIKSSELALRFVWDNPAVSVALSGMTNGEQVEENSAAAGRMEILSAAEQSQIRALFEQNQKLADLYCTGCGYCLPCPNEVQIPENFRYMNWHRVWGMTEEAKAAYGKLSAEGGWTPWTGPIKGKKAEDCIQCGECEAKCPQNIPIVEQLQEVARVLGGRGF
jgi:predicted aldo/keto reductase-like oxidoreductase